MHALADETNLVHRGLSTSRLARQLEDDPKVTLWFEGIAHGLAASPPVRVALECNRILLQHSLQ